MFFFLSKTIGYLVRPTVLVGLLFLLHLLLKNHKWKQRALVGAILFFFLFSNRFIANEAIRFFEAPLVPIAELELRDEPFEWGILLTGVTGGKKELSDRVYIEDNADRVNHTVMLYKKGLIKKILISGGTGKLINPSFSEANQLKTVFLYMGVRQEDLIIEGDSRNTHESAVAVRKLLPKEDGKNCLLITSSTHIPRAIGCFRKEGLNCAVFPTDLIFRKRELTPDALLLPSTEAVKIWEEIFKESAGRIAYTLAGYI